LTVLDRDALLKGAATSIVVCLPLALVSQALTREHRDDPSRWVFLLFLGVLLGFVAGGWVAARAAAGVPYSNGATAALAAYVVIQGIALVVRLIGGDPVHVVVMVFNGLIAYGCGLTGALLATRSRARP
jgi:hypothetical protein